MGCSPWFRNCIETSIFGITTTLALGIVLESEFSKAPPEAEWIDWRFRHEAGVTQLGSQKFAMKKDGVTQPLTCQNSKSFKHACC